MQRLKMFGEDLCQCEEGASAWVRQLSGSVAVEDKRLVATVKNLVEVSGEQKEK